MLPIALKKIIFLNKVWLVSKRPVHRKNFVASPLATTTCEDAKAPRDGVLKKHRMALVKLASQIGFNQHGNPGSVSKTGIA